MGNRKGQIREGKRENNLTFIRQGSSWCHSDGQVSPLQCQDPSHDENPSTGAAVVVEVLSFSPLQNIF